MRRHIQRHSRPSSPFPARVVALRQRMAAWKAPVLLVTNPRDIHYLTGFPGDDSWALVGPTGPVTVISDFRFEEQIRHQAPQVHLVIRKGAIAKQLGAVVRGRRWRKIAVQADYVTLAQRKTIRKNLRGTAGIVEVDDGLLKQRAVKDSTEVAAIKQALAIQQEAYRNTLAQIRGGQSEQQIAALLEYEMRLLGADGSSFPTIVAADANASLPHAVPGSAKVRLGSLLLIDFGARWGGYCSDLTRVVALGRMKPKLREIYQIVLDAQLAAIDAIAPGKSLKEVDAVARKLIAKAGYGKRFGHGLGHGIGLDIHEQPTLSFRSEGVLETGQVVTVEPGIYLPGVGGVRIEDDVLVTDIGNQVLSDLPKDLASAII